MSQSATGLRRMRLAVGEHAPRSLCWRGNDLVDWVSGGDVWTADGRFVSARRSWGYDRIDAAVADPTGRWAVVHERTGTAGVLLRDGKVVRELHRSPYHADAFVYPVCLFSGPGGRTLLAHCPDSCARIEIDDAETGEHLTRSASRKEPDFFHSRLTASPGSKRLLSAGWVWHPWSAVVWFDVAAVLQDPKLLDRLDGTEQSGRVDLAEESSAAWLDEDHVLLGGSDEPEDPHRSAEEDWQRPGPRLRPNGVAVYDVVLRSYGPSIQLGEPPGTMMPAGRYHLVTFFQHPRLVSLRSGKVLHEWSDVDSGRDVSSMVGQAPVPVLALDPSGSRFAVGAGDAVEVVAIDPGKLEI